MRNNEHFELILHSSTIKREINNPECSEKRHFLNQDIYKCNYKVQKCRSKLQYQRYQEKNISMI
jgi:hypothetical protein